MSGSASPVKYTCVAKNEGGVSKGNVTLVYSETVATYLDNRDISMLLVTGLIAGVMVFLAIGSAVICFVMHRKHSRQIGRHHHGAGEHEQLSGRLGAAVVSLLQVVFLIIIAINQVSS